MAEIKYMNVTPHMRSHLDVLQAGKQVVPVLLAMSSVGNAAQVRGMALDALGEVWRSAAADQKLSGQLSAHFEALLDTKDHEVGALVGSVHSRGV